MGVTYEMASIRTKALSRQSGIANLVEHGRLDLVLHIDDGFLQAHFQLERLYSCENREFKQVSSYRAALRTGETWYSTLP